MEGGRMVKQWIMGLALLSIVIVLFAQSVCAETGGPVTIKKFIEAGDYEGWWVLASATDSDQIPFKQGDTLRFRGSVDNGSTVSLQIYHVVGDVPPSTAQFERTNQRNIDFTWKVPTNYMFAGEWWLFISNTGDSNATVNLKIERTSTEAQDTATGLGVCAVLVIVLVVVIVVIIFAVWKLMNRKKQPPVPQPPPYPQQPYYPPQQYPQQPPMGPPYQQPQQYQYPPSPPPPYPQQPPQ